MTATFARHAWPAPPTSARWPGWRFGREVRLSERPGATPALQWQLRRNFSISSRQMLHAYALLCALSLSVALLLWATGTAMVMVLAGLELALVGVTLLVCARHAGDRETLTLVGRALLVERTSGARVEHAAFSADRLTVEPAAGQNSLVEIAGQGRTMRVGRFLRPDLRADFARELRLALRQAPASPPDPL